MRRYFESLRPADVSAIHSVPDGLFLVRVDRVQYRWHKQKPYYQIRFAVLKPRHLTGCLMTGRLYCTPRAMWKLSWTPRHIMMSVRYCNNRMLEMYQRVEMCL